MCFSAVVNAVPGSHAYVVRRPQAGDAMGDALRTAYTDRAMPADMMELLRRLDAVTTGRRH